VREDCSAVERISIAAALTALDVDAAQIQIDGVRHVRVGRHEATFMTQVGGVAITRW
jgi:hypothetical protein